MRTSVRRKERETQPHTRRDVRKTYREGKMAAHHLAENQMVVKKEGRKLRLRSRKVKTGTVKSLPGQTNP